MIDAGNSNESNEEVNFGELCKNEEVNFGESNKNLEDESQHEELNSS